MHINSSGMIIQIPCKILLVLLAFSMDLNHAQESKEVTEFSLNDAQLRHARLRCLEQYPQADPLNFSDTAETHCYLQCYLYRTGLMDLSSRGLDSSKFIGIWEKIEEAFQEDTCLERFDFSEPLNGKCSDSYRKLMQFRDNCMELFELTFSTNSSWKLTEDPKRSKQIGQSATEFCDAIDDDNNNNNNVAIEISQDNDEKDVPLYFQYVEKLKCIFANIHYLDAYGRIDESEIDLSYQEAKEHTPETRAIIRECCHRANTKYDANNYVHLVVELQSCLKKNSPIYGRVYKLRDETSRQY